MTTRKQVEANRKNALASTGPKTSEGKARVARNAVYHGLRSNVPVLPGERWEDWQIHRTGVFRSLAPVGTLQQALAERVALCLWRLQRVAAYETATTALAIEEIAEEARRPAERRNPFFAEVSETYGRADRLHLAAAEEELVEAKERLEIWESAYRLLEQVPRLADGSQINGGDAYLVFQDLADAACELNDVGVATQPLADNAFLASLGVPEHALPDVCEWDGWTATIMRKGLERLADAASIEPEKLLARALHRRQQAQTEGRANIQILEKKVGGFRRRTRVLDVRLRQRRMLPDTEALEKIQRYEAHLSRQILQALHELQRLQAARAGQSAPLPGALDVIVEGGANSPALESIQEELQH